MKKKWHPRIIIISGPSGAGKTTLINRLFRKKIIKENFLLGISCTTRSPRKGEKNGKDYFFISREEFLQRIKQKYFLEYQKVLDDFYGTPIFFLRQAEKEKKDLILCIDVKGGMDLLKQYGRDRVVTIFITVSDTKELLNRLNKRKENTLQIKKRINLAKKELKFLKYYDYLINNQQLNNAVQLLTAVLIAQILRRR